MRVSADLSSKIAFLSRFGKMRLMKYISWLVATLTHLVIINQTGQFEHAFIPCVTVPVNIMTHSVNYALGFILTEMRAMLYDIVLQNMNI